MSVFKMISAFFSPGRRVTPAEAAERVRSGAALLVDVREPREWNDGVAQGAVLLPLSDLNGARQRWKPFLEQAGQQRELLFYCAGGGRSGVAAGLLAKEGFNTANTGALSDWAASGWPVVPPAGKS